MEKQPATIDITGHVLIKDDLGNVLVNQQNAVHPQNMARVFARALSNEDCFYIHRVAFGNGGTHINSALEIEYLPPNDGQDPDPAGWESRLYNETYSEIIDDSSLDVTTGPGASPADDPPVQVHVSGPGVRSTELGLTSQAVVEVVINPNEPTGQDIDDSNQTNPDSLFTFDEIGLYSKGLPHESTPGRQDVDIGGRKAEHATGLSPNTTYKFQVVVDSNAPRTVTVRTPAVGSGPNGELVYRDIVALINNAPDFGAIALISDDDTGVNTFGYLRFVSKSVGSQSKVMLIDSNDHDFLFRVFVGFRGFRAPIDGQDAGVANDTVSSENQRERLLTHLIFSPILVSKNRSIIITYTLTISVGRSIA